MAEVDVTWMVSAIPPSRYRAGRRFTPVAVEVEVADLTEAEAEALLRDPMLRVEMVGGEPEAEAEPTPPPEAAPEAEAMPEAMPEPEAEAAPEAEASPAVEAAPKPKPAPKAGKGKAEAKA